MSAPMPSVPALAQHRLHDWMPRLAAVVVARMGAPFVWGLHDCCVFAADCVQAVTGRDLGADLRGSYRTEREAARLLHRLGGVASLAADRLGPVVPAASAAPGDIGLCRLNGRDCLAVCVGGHFLAPGHCGLVAIGLPDIARAWRCTGQAHG